MLARVDALLSKMSGEKYPEMLDAMGEHRLELRLALLFHRSAAADNTLGEAEIQR